MAAVMGLAVTNREADGYVPAHGPAPLQIISSETKETVIGFMGWGQQGSIAVVGYPVANMDHPHCCQGDSQHQNIQAVKVINFGPF